MCIAFGALHVVAGLVLLYGDRALGALLGLGVQPNLRGCAAERLASSLLVEVAYMQVKKTR